MAYSEICFEECQSRQFCREDRFRITDWLFKAHLSQTQEWSIPMIRKSRKMIGYLDRWSCWQNQDAWKLIQLVETDSGMWKYFPRMQGWGWDPTLSQGLKTTWRAARRVYIGNSTVKGRLRKKLVHCWIRQMILLMSFPGDSWLSWKGSVKR